MSTKKVEHSDEEWRAKLTEEEYHILRQSGTQPAFCGLYFGEKRPGTYYCKGCDTPLFSSEDKFDSGSGWPSFKAGIDSGSLTSKVDKSHGMVRTEICCATCDGHLGHAFQDGPPPHGMRL